MWFRVITVAFIIRIFIGGVLHQQILVQQIFLKINIQIGTVKKLKMKYDF